MEIRSSFVKFFNITGSCDPARHYMIPAERRLVGVQELIDKQAYFVIHAPRQTGKTTSMKALARRLTDEGRHAALRFSCQNAQVFPDDIGAAERTVWHAIVDTAASALPEELRPPASIEAETGSFLQAQLARWAGACPRPLVLIFDEIDAIGGPSLKSILSQLRTGFDNRPAAFPWSVILCGMRDVRDYKAASGGDPTRLGTSSPFNIKEESFRIAASPKPRCASCTRSTRPRPGRSSPSGPSDVPLPSPRGSRGSSTRSPGRWSTR